MRKDGEIYDLNIHLLYQFNIYKLHKHKIIIKTNSLDNVLLYFLMYYCGWLQTSVLF